MVSDNEHVRGKHTFTHEYYIEQLKKLYSDRYTFERTQYNGAGNKVIITCKKHGDFETYASAFLNSEEFSGCRKCRDEKRQSPIRKEPKKPLTALHRFIALANKNNYFLYDYSQTVYTGKEEFVDVICKAHGLFTAEARKHKQGKAPCLICRRNRSKWGKKRAEEEYERLCKKNQSR